MRGWVVFLGIVCAAGVGRTAPPSDEVCVLVTQCVDTPGADRAKCLKGFGVTTGDAKRCQKVADDMLPEAVKQQMERRQPGRAHGREK